MGNPFFLAPVTEPVDACGGHFRDEQAHAHDGDPGENLEPHRDALPEAKHSLPGPLKVTWLRSLPGKLCQEFVFLILFFIFITHYKIQCMLHNILHNLLAGIEEHD